MTNMTGQFLNYEKENRLFNICVGKTVGGKSPEVSRLLLKVWVEFLRSGGHLAKTRIQHLILVKILSSEISLFFGLFLGRLVR